MATAKEKALVAGMAVALVLGGIAGVILGFVLDDPEPEVITVSPPEIVSIEPRTFVALGDSYSAGEGIQPYADLSGDIEDFGDNCHRSTGGYPTLLLFHPDVTVEFRACSGARVPHVYETPQTTGEDANGNPVHNRFGVQTSDGVLNEDVGLVTISIGGNDVGFSNVLKFCASPSHSSCLNDEYTDRRTGSTYASLRDWADAALPELGTNLEVLYERVLSDAPNARLVVLGYPFLFPATRPTGSLVCLGIEAVYSDGERSGIRDLGAELNATIQHATEVTGAEFVDTSAVFDGHEPCGAMGEWVNAVKIEKWITFEGPEFHRGPFHPNPQGQRIFAYILACYLDRTSSTTAMTSPTGDGQQLPTPDEIAACVGDTMSG